MTNVKPIIGIVPLARSTFDVAYAEEMLAAAMNTLRGIDAELVGPTTLLFDADAVKAAVPELKAARPDLLLVLQVSFTDATMTVELARDIDAPMMMWSFPEARTGGRLRLNSFCGVNLAAHALSRGGAVPEHVHSRPDDPATASAIADAARATMIARRLRETKVMLVGEHPAGFDACDYDEGLKSRLGVSVERRDLKDFIEEVRALPDGIADEPLRRRGRDLVNLGEMDPVATRKTMKVYAALRDQTRERGCAGVAVRCWPQFFVDYGCAACGALAMLNEDRVPAGCEADMFGVVSSLIAQWTSGDAVFNTDLVDIDADDDTVVFWHCGQAPIDMADPEVPARATVHSNRKMPLLSEFPLKPGRFTMIRLTRGGGELRMALGGGEMLRRPLAYSGTAGVAKLDVPAGDFMKTLVREGLEHHSTIVYGECRPALRAVARRLGLPVVELT